MSNSSEAGRGPIRPAMSSARGPLVLRLGLAAATAWLWVAGEARGESCDPAAYRGPVSLLIVQSGQKVQAFAASVKDAPILARDATTVVFGDGRVVTSDVEKASAHLNQLGWGGRRIDVVASFRARARRRPARAVG